MDDVMTSPLRPSGHKTDRQVAIDRLVGFARQFGEDHLLLACHAAFPLAFTPDLLYHIWANFVPQLPWTAVADVLLSRLCREVGYELYEMDISVRNLLLEELKEDENFGNQRLEDLADFLLSYIARQLRSEDPDIRDLANSQRWTALAYTRPVQAARELAQSLSELVGKYEENHDLKNKAELIRVASLAEVFAEPLAEFELLLIYANAMANLARDNEEIAKIQLGKILVPGHRVIFAGESLTVPKELISETKEDDLESIFRRYICICPSFKLDVLTSIFKRFSDTKGIKPYQMPLVAQIFCERGYIQYDREFLHYNVNKDKGSEKRETLETDLISDLHKKWAEEYDNFLNNFSSYFSDADISVLLYHKLQYENETQNTYNYLTKITEEYIKKIREKGCQYSIKRIIERIEQLHLFNNLLSSENQKKFFKFLNNFEEQSVPEKLINVISPYICVCPSFRLDLLSLIFKHFPESGGIKPYQMPLVAQIFCERDYIQYDRDFLHYNVNQDRASEIREKLESDFILDLYKKWAEEYDNFLNNFSSYFSDADICILLYHKLKYEYLENKTQNIYNYLTETTEDHIKKMRKKGCRYSIKRIIQRIEQLHLFDNLLSTEEQKNFLEFLSHL